MNMTQRTSSAAEIRAGFAQVKSPEESKDQVTIARLDLGSPFLLGFSTLVVGKQEHQVVVVGKNHEKFCSIGGRLERSSVEEKRYYSSRVVANAAYSSLCAGDPLLRSLEGRTEVEMIQHLATTSK